MKPKRMSLDDFAQGTPAGELVRRTHTTLAEMQSKVVTLSDASRALLRSIPSRADELSAPCLDAYAAQLNAIEHLRARPANWSANPVSAPDAARTGAAQRGLIMLLLAGIPAPTVMLLNDGTVAAFWRRDNTYASMDFDADGEFPWSVANGLAVTSGTWTGGTLPVQLRDIICS
jgi:hypothetical protein